MEDKRTASPPGAETSLTAPRPYLFHLVRTAVFGASAKKSCESAEPFNQLAVKTQRTAVW